MLMNNIVITNNQPEEISIRQSENQTILINGGGEIIGVIDVKVNGESVVTGNIAYVITPTKTSELINDSGFITQETDPTVSTAVKSITLADINSWNNKQNELVSGSNIKTINNISLLGSGNLDVGGVNYSAGTGIEIVEDVINNTITSYNDLTDLPTIPTKTSDLINDDDFINGNQLAQVAYTASYDDLIDTPLIPTATSDLENDSDFIDSSELNTALADKQDELISGTNIKTINGFSILGAGDIIITGGNTDIYSTTEVIIGKWIDGKNLYRKTITGISSIGATNHNIANIDTVMIDSSHSFILKTTGRVFPIGYCAWEGTDFASTSVTTTEINIAGTIPNFSSATITLLYTKTTE